jgi:hypothetical protein
MTAGTRGGSGVRSDGLFGLGENACVDYSQNFIKELLRCATDSFHPPRTIVDGLHLLTHDVPGKAGVAGHRHVEWRIPLSVRDRATNGKTRAAIEVIYTHHDSGPAAHLFVPSLRVEREDNQIPLSRNVPSHYHTSFPCDSPQSYSPSNASGELEATKSSIL